MMGGELFERAEREVLDRHADFQDLGRGGRTAAEFEFELAMPYGFELVTPEGHVLDQPAILAHLDELGALNDPAFTIRIEEIDVIWEGVDGVLVTYVEAQHRNGRDSRRRSTAFFVPDDEAPHRVVWCHLHETWMQG